MKHAGTVAGLALGLAFLVACRATAPVKETPKTPNVASSTAEGPTTTVRYLKKRIAVAPIRVVVAHLGVATYGEQLHAMLITELRKTNRFIVVERENLEGLIGEQDLTATGRIAPGSGPKMGKLIGAQLMVQAEITDFDDQSARDGQIGIGPVAVGRSKSSTLVAMDMRIYNTETGVVIASENVAAEKVTSGMGLGLNFGYFSFSGKKSQSSTLGFVLRELIQKALEKIIADSEKVPWTARVIRIEGDEVYLNAGSAIGVRTGDRFTVVSLGKALTDPDTGEVLSNQERPIGEIEVARVEEKLAVARVVSKTGEIKERDKIVER
jgi:curli biogenesis system outer membrane secretion channel CsgG